MIKRIAGLAGMTVASILATNCIAPPPAAQCPCSSTTSATSASTSASTTNADTSTAKSSSATSAPPAVKPTAALIADGKSNTLINIDPPGSWFVLNDRTAKGTMVPSSTGDFPAALTKAGTIHTSGKGFTDWGGGIGFNFVGADSLTPLDASTYSGITFKASGTQPVHVGLATKATMPEFGDCTKCYDHYAVDITDLSPTPKTYTFKWSQLRAGGWGAPKAALDPHLLVGLNFTSKGATPWDFTLDDIAFTP
ncbi:MAG TPA: hypothetical protein VGI39_04560 [Polyangiaceae bacterium]